MRMCHDEEERLEKSMNNLRKVKRYWRDIDLDRKCGTGTRFDGAYELEEVMGTATGDN